MTDKEKIIRLKEYLNCILNVTQGKYKEAIQDTIYFVNALIEEKGDSDEKVEILEEENKIEKLENGQWYIEGKGGKLIMLKDKVDELIDEINKLKEYK